jgi:esterase/lipase
MMTESRKLMKSMICHPKRANYPLLLIYGGKDNIVDKRGCDMIFNAWKFDKKEYEVVENGTHGKSTVMRAREAINKWTDEVAHFLKEE